MSIDELIKSCSTYGYIYESCGDWHYKFDDEKIADEKWKRLSKDQQIDLCNYDGTEEDWYKANAYKIWDEVERLAGEEEAYAVDVCKWIIEEIDAENEEANKYHAMIDSEYYKDRI